MAKSNTRPLSGMRDFLPGDVLRRKYVVGIVENVYQSYGFEPLETDTGNEPILADTLGVGGTTALTSIVTDTALLPEQKIQLLIKLFSFTEEEARKIIEP